MIGAQRAGAATVAGLMAAALLVGAAPPAQAAGPGWRLVWTRSFGRPPEYGTLNSVVSTGRNNAWAFGSTDVVGPARGAPVAEHWNGRSWRVVALPSGLTGSIAAASAPAANDVWAVGGPGRFVLHYNGSKWSVAKRWKDRLGLTGVTAFSPTDVWVFGTPGTWHLHGSTWTKVTGLAGSIQSASALSPRDIWAVASSATAPSGIMLRYNGRTWDQVKRAALAGLMFGDLLAVSPGNIFVAASSSRASFLLHLKGTAWTRVAFPAWPVTPFALAPDGSGGLWMNNFSINALTGPTVVHLSRAGQWRQYRVPRSGLLFGLAHVPGTASMWGTGDVATRTGVDAAIWAYGPVG
jgi:hypothetical protein